MAKVLTPFDAATDTRPSPNGSNPAAPVPVVMTITPDLAREWTLLNTRNRAVRYNRVAKFARDMAAGKWLLNGETIKIVTDGTILDGQHRLYACMQAEVPFDSIVIRGLPVEAQDTIDTGAARSMADQFGLHGEANAALLASITRWSWKWGRGVKTTGEANLDPTHIEMIAFLDAEPRLRDATAWADRARRCHPKVNGSVWGMAWMLFHGSDPLAADVFLHKVTTGENCATGDPALAFRNRIMNAREEGLRLNQYVQLGYLIIAWNAFKDDRTLVRLQPPRGGFTPKTFPEPR